MSNTPPEALVIAAVPEPVLSIVPALHTTLPWLVICAPLARYLLPPESVSSPPEATRRFPVNTPPFHALPLPVISTSPGPASVPPLNTRLLRLALASALTPTTPFEMRHCPAPLPVLLPNVCVPDTTSNTASWAIWKLPPFAVLVPN